MTERLHFHFSLSCIGEGNGNPVQCSCLENPRDGGAWWDAIYGVTQSQTQLKLLSSSSSSVQSSCSVMSNSQRTHGLQPTRLLSPWDFPGKSTGVGCHCLLRLVAQSCPIVCNPMDCSLSGSSVREIFQARILEQVAISFSWGSS